MKYPRQPVEGEQVKVYRNLHTGKLSVMGAGEHGRMSVIAHVDSIVLRDARFVVNERGRQRVLRERRKNVHAFAVGTLIAVGTPRVDTLQRRVTYNPYRCGSFVDETGEPRHRANRAYIEAGGLIAVA